MIYTDALQTLIMVVGAIILTVKGEGLKGLSQQPLLSGVCPVRTQVPTLGRGRGVDSQRQGTRQSAPRHPPLGDRGCMSLSHLYRPAASCHQLWVISGDSRMQGQCTRPGSGLGGEVRTRACAHTIRKPQKTAQAPAPTV